MHQPRSSTIPHTDVTFRPDSTHGVEPIIPQPSVGPQLFWVCQYGLDRRHSLLDLPFACHKLSTDYLVDFGNNVKAALPYHFDGGGRRY